MQVNSPNPTSFYPLNTEPPSGFGFRPNFPPTLQNFYLPFNPAYVELPEAKAEDLTPRSGWISKLNDVEKKYLEERNENSELEEKIQHLRLQMSAMDNASTANLEQLAAHITSLEQEINIHKTREEDLQGQIKARDEFINKVKETVQENEENYRKHLDVVKREFEKLEDNNKEFKERIAALTIENQSLRLEAAEAKNETAKIQGIRDTEKLLIQNQLKETQSELTKLNNKYYELTKDLERTKYMLEDVSGKSSKAERELIYKETEIKRLSEMTNVANEKLRSEDRDFEKTLNERVMTMTLKSREEKLDYETKYKLEQKASFELKTQLEQLSKTTQSLRQENYELKCTNKSNEERIMKLELLEQETALKFSSLKEKYDAHFTKRDEETFNKEVKLVKCREEVESLKIEKEHHERLIFQYQNFLKLYNLDYEFNSLTRLDKGPFNKTTVEMKHEAREKAAREYYRENEAKRYNDIVREKYRLLDEGAEAKTETLRKEMDNIANDMEDEWKKLFTNLSEFKSKINP